MSGRGFAPDLRESIFGCKTLGVLLGYRCENAGNCRAERANAGSKSFGVLRAPRAKRGAKPLGNRGVSCLHGAGRARDRRKTGAVLADWEKPEMSKNDAYRGALIF